MVTLLEIGVRNALAATALAILAAGLGWALRRPALTHSLWLLVLLKFLTPPLVPVPIAWPMPPGSNPALRSGQAAIEANAAPSETLPSARPPAGATDTGEGIHPPAPSDLPEQGGGQEAVASLPPDVPAVSGPEDRQADAQPPRAAPAAGARSPAPEAAPLPTPVPPATGTASWTQGAAALWLAGSLLWFGQAGLAVRRFRRLVRYAPTAPAVVQDQARELAGRLGLRRCPTVLLLPGTVSPMIWGLGRGLRLLLPAELLARLNEEQRAALVTHELAHLRRRDHWVRGLELLTTGLYWWHPVAWWARRALREAEEECCDAWVVWALPAVARAYATALLETLDFLSRAGSAPPATASAIGRVPSLRRRLIMIMRGTTPRSLSTLGFWTVLGLGAALLPLLPTWAQTEPAPGRPGPPAEGAGQGGSGGTESVEAYIQRLRAELHRQQAQLQQTESRIKELEEELRRGEARAREDARARARSRPVPPDESAPNAGPKLSGEDFRDGSPGQLRELERKVETLLQEVRALRQGPGPQGPEVPARGFLEPITEGGARGKPIPELRRFTGHSLSISSVVFSPEGRTALSGSGDNTVRLWNVATGRELRRFKGHFGCVQSVAFAPDGQRALSGSYDNTLILWDVARGVALEQFHGLTGREPSVFFTSGGWRIPPGHADAVNWGYADRIKSVAFLPDGSRALSGSETGIVRLWELDASRRLRQFSGHTGGLGRQQPLAPLAPREIRRFLGHTGPAQAVAASPDGKLALSGSFDGTVRLWDMESGKELRRFAGHDGQWVLHVAFSPDGRQALSSGADNAVRLWDVATGQEVSRFTGHTDRVECAVFSPEGGRILSAAFDGTARLWDTDGSLRAILRGHKGPVLAAAISPDGHVALTGGDDTTIRLWRLPQGRNGE